MVMRSSASAGLFDAGTGLVSAGMAPTALRRCETRSSTSLFCALRAETGSDTTDQRSRLGLLLSLGREHVVPSKRSLGAIVTAPRTPA